MDDVELTFDASMFLDGISSITKSIDSMKSSMDSFAKTSSSKVQKVTAGIGTMMKGMVVFNMAMGAVKKGMAQIPELGKTFSIAGDIMMRNFLWPIRQELIPLLQKLLDWVRDNRARFVKWGQVVANIFRAIVSIVKGFLQILKGMWEKISAGIDRVFGKTVGSMTDLINLALFKITALALFIQMTLQPVFDFIATMFVAALESAKEFFGGLMNGLGDVLPEFGSMWESLGRIATALGLANTKGGALVSTFKILGNVLGAVIGPILRGIASMLDEVALGFEQLSIGIDMFKAWRKGDKNEINRLKLQSKIISAEKEVRDEERMKRQKEAWKSAGSDIWSTIKGTTSPKGSVTNTKNSSAINDNRKITIHNTINGAQAPAAIVHDVSRKTKDALKESRYRAGK